MLSGLHTLPLALCRFRSFGIVVGESFRSLALCLGPNRRLQEVKGMWNDMQLPCLFTKAPEGVRTPKQTLPPAQTAQDGFVEDDENG